MPLSTMKCACCTWISALLLLAACAPVPEYSTGEEGSRYKLLAFDEPRQALDSAALIYVHMAVLNFPTGDTIAYSEHLVLDATDQSILTRHLRTRFTGDSLAFIAPGVPRIGVPTAPADTTICYIRIKGMKSHADLRDARTAELLALDAVVRSDSVRMHYTEYKGVWMRTLLPGDTAQVREGRALGIHYRGALPGGRIFDDTRRGDGRFYFVAGQEGQVIEGIALALERMHRGEVARVIIPSWLAWGSRGSAAAGIAPYQTVVYTIEVVELAPYSSISRK